MLLSAQNCINGRSNDSKTEFPMTPIALDGAINPRKNVEDFKINPFGLNSFCRVSVGK